MKKTVSAILALTLLLSSLVSCSDSGTDNTDATEAADTPAGEISAEDTAADEPEDRSSVPDGLPDNNYGGAEYVILSDNYTVGDFYQEELTGDVVSDAVYNRNVTVSDRFNVKISNLNDEYTNISPLVQRSVTSADNAYSIVSYHEIEAANAASSKYFTDWYTIEYVDPTRPWWNASSFHNLSIAGKAFLAYGSMNLYTLKSTYCMYVNKKLAEDHHVTGLNDLVLAGTWTYDRLYEFTEDSWQDLNGNGTQDYDDYYGFSTNSTSYVTTYTYAFGEITVRKDENDVPFLDMNQEKFSDIVNAVYRLLYESNGAFYTTGWNDHRNLFIEDRALFLNGVFGQACAALRDMETDFAIIPYPKWNEEQEQYYSMADGSASLAAVPVSASDLSFIGCITEAMNAESWKQVVPALYDTALKVKFTRDAESAAMIDLIFDNVVLDLGFVYADYNGMGFTVSNLIGEKKNDFASFYAKNYKIWNKKIEKIVKSFSED